MSGSEGQEATFHHAARPPRARAGRRTTTPPAQASDGRRKLRQEATRGVHAPVVQGTACPACLEAYGVHPQTELSGGGPGQALGPGECLSAPAATGHGAAEDETATWPGAREHPCRLDRGAISPRGGGAWCPDQHLHGPLAASENRGQAPGLTENLTQFSSAAYTRSATSLGRVTLPRLRDK